MDVVFKQDPTELLLIISVFCALNALNVNIRLTFTVSLLTAVFLDLTIFKGERFKQKRLLDTRCYQKPMNIYLFMPFNSEHTTACKISIVHGELRRYIKRSSSITLGGFNLTF
jgi:hypothetical protein